MLRAVVRAKGKGKKEEKRIRKIEGVKERRGKERGEGEEREGRERKVERKRDI
jgi:hypothetical protein